MTDCDHIFSRWIRGTRRPEVWRRVCGRCGHLERSETPPERNGERKGLKFDSPNEDREELHIRGRMAKLEGKALGAKLRGNILAHRRATGGH